jgi:hypothetical protein
MRFNDIRGGKKCTGCKTGRAEATSLANYGVRNPAQSPAVKEVIVHTNLERHGVQYPMQSPEILEKSKATCRKKFG